METEFFEKSSIPESAYALFPVLICRGGGAKLVAECGPKFSKSGEEAEKFINVIIKHNQIWNLGLQFLSVQKVSDRLFIDMKKRATGYTKCVCPCSPHLLRKWQSSYSILELSDFKECDSYIFPDPMEFMRHVQSNNRDYYHRIVMRIIQSSYSSLLAKFNSTMLQKSDMSFHDIHKGAVQLPNITCYDYWMQP